jgi:hypothetical protein
MVTDRLNILEGQSSQATSRLDQLEIDSCRMEEFSGIEAGQTTPHHGDRCLYCVCVCQNYSQNVLLARTEKWRNSRENAADHTYASLGSSRAVFGALVYQRILAVLQNRRQLVRSAFPGCSRVTGKSENDRIEIG